VKRIRSIVLLTLCFGLLVGFKTHGSESRYNGKGDVVPPIHVKG